MSSRQIRAWDTHELAVMFPDEASVTVVPWPAVVRPLRTEDERDLLRALLAVPPRADQFADLDPRTLSGSQGWVTRAGVAYYLHEDTYRRSGRTYADQFKIGNKYPVVHQCGNDLVILSGHHRAAAALLNGEPLRARRVQAEWELNGSAATVVTPSLLSGGHEPSLAHQACPDRWMAEAFVNMRATAWLTDDTDHAIKHLLRELGVEETWLRHQLHYAATGRLLPADV